MPCPSQNAIINYVRCALKHTKNDIIDCIASYYGAHTNRLTATLNQTMIIIGTLLDMDKIKGRWPINCNNCIFYVH